MNNICFSFEDMTEFIFQGNTIKKAPSMIGRKADQHVDVAIWAEIGSKNGTKERQFGNLPTAAKILESLSIRQDAIQPSRALIVPG